MHCNEYSQGLHYYPFVVNLDRCVASCSTLNYLSNRVCIPNKTEHLHAFNMITEINELKTSKGIYHANINVTLMVESVIRIKSGTTINTVVSVKVKKKEIILICDISYESAIGSKPLSVRVDKEDGFI